jgi:hypothetical protein
MAVKNNKSSKKNIIEEIDLDQIDLDDLKEA